MWRELPLSTLADIISGGTPSRDVQEYWNGDIPWVTPTDMTASKTNYLFETANRITRKGLINSSAKMLPPGTILFTSRATIGLSRIAAMPVCTNQGFKSLLPFQIIDGNFLFYQISRLRYAFERYAAGSTFPEINKKDTGRILVSHPVNRMEQQKIATILTSIDTAIEKTEALIEKYQQIKSGLMHDLFTRGVLPNGQLRPTREQAPELYQETKIGWIPKEWQYELLDRLANRGSGHTPNKGRSEYWNGGVKWISLADSNRLDKLYISDTSYEISQQGIQNSSAVLHPAGIVVLSRDAGIGKSAITTEPMAVSQHFMCWRCEEKIDNHFLYYWLQFNKRTFENIAMGSTILTIGLGYFKKLKIACPTEMDEQKIIAAKLTQLDQYIFRLKDDLMKKHSQKLGLMQDLLTGKVPVTVSENADQEEVHA